MCKRIIGNLIWKSWQDQFGGFIFFKLDGEAYFFYNNDFFVYFVFYMFNDH